MTIHASTFSDDHVIEIQFDATKWFEQAGDEEILGLCSIDWGGDYEADEVAKFFSGHETKELFDYLATNPVMRFTEDTVGFECSIDEEDACSWIGVNRPHLHEIVTEASRY